VFGLRSPFGSHGAEDGLLDGIWKRETLGDLFESEDLILQGK
jgi:hypothetical protein